MERARNSTVANLLEGGAVLLRLGEIKTSVVEEPTYRTLAGIDQESIRRLFSELESGVGSPEVIQEYRAFSRMYGRIWQQMKRHKCPQVTP